MGQKYAIDKNLPVPLFHGKKEGDAVYLSLHGREFKLICRQQPYSFGGQNFEDLMLKILQGFQRSTLPPSTAHEPSREQRQIISQKALEEYEKSFN